MKRHSLVVLAALIGLTGLTPPASATYDYLPLWRGDADAEATALRFTRDFLGYQELDRVVSAEFAGGEAWVDVGALLPDGKPRTAATVHLARFGSAPDAPWEVVGTRDTILTLDRPAYGSVTGPTIEAGGVITGVDESLHLQVLQSSQPAPLGESCCVPAGGQQQPWSSRVSFTGAQPGTVVLAVSTGGHVAEVEAFAVTGLRVP